MTADALAVVQVLFTSLWRLFTEWYIPGTHTTPGMFILFCFAAALSINFIKRLFGLSGDLASSNRRVQASRERSSHKGE